MEVVFGLGGFYIIIWVSQLRVFCLFGRLTVSTYSFGISFSTFPCTLVPFCTLLTLLVLLQRRYAYLLCSCKSVITSALWNLSLFLLHGVGCAIRFSQLGITRLFNLRFIRLGIVQVLQFGYQRSRLYTLRAMAKAHPMDVTTETSVPARRSVFTHLLALIPFLFVGHVCLFWHVMLHNVF
jgi:hypothetical protein